MIEEYPLAWGILRQLTRFMVIARLHTLADNLYYLNQLCNLFQRKGLSLDEFHDGLLAVRATLSSFANGACGQFFKTFMENFDVQTKTLYKDTILTFDMDYEKDLKLVKEDFKAVSAELLQSMDVRFDVDKKIDNLKFLSIKSIKSVSNEDFDNYGIEGLENLVRDLETRYKKQNGDQILDLVPILMEWKTVMF
jgi:hypothetical protein